MHTRSPRLLPALLALSLLVALPLHAQKAAKTADEKWSDLVQLAKTRPSVATNATDAPAAKQAQQAQLQTLATEARNFTRDNPSHSQVAKARQMESKSRLIISLLAADTPTVAVKALATDVRHDTRLPEADRYEVAFLAEMAGEDRGKKDHAVWLRARERSARALMAEFPGQPGGYGLLLQVASRDTGAPAASAARELIASSAPAEIKTAAQDLLDRQALAGKTLATATTGVLGGAKVLEPAQGKPLILYTWRPDNPGSLGLAKELARLAPANAVIIGINLSHDVAAAKTAAAQLPGSQLYDGRGFDSPLVKQLRLTSASLVYLVDRQGVIISTDAQNDLAAQLSALEGRK